MFWFEELETLFRYTLQNIVATFAFGLTSFWYVGYVELRNLYYAGI